MCAALLLWPACAGNTYVQGKRLYDIHCANCHMPDGNGLAALYPPLAGSDYLQAHQELLPCIIRHGLRDTITVKGKVYDQPMEGIKNLNEVEITNIINYINQAWGNALGETTLPQTKARLGQCN